MLPQTTSRRPAGPPAWALAWACLLASALAGCGKTAGGSTDGAAIFADACARCHGEAGKPEPAMAQSLGVKDLTAPEFHARASADDIRTRIQQGSENRIMPAFASVLTDEQIEALVVYVQSLKQP